MCFLTEILFGIEYRQAICFETDALWILDLKILRRGGMMQKWNKTSSSGT